MIVLDLEMPRMDGLTFLRKLMSEDPIPVVVCSALTGAGTEAAMRALEEGAVEIVTKPRLGVHGFLAESAVSSSTPIAGAAQARLRVPRRPGRAAPRLTADAVLPSRAGPLAGDDGPDRRDRRVDGRHRGADGVSSRSCRPTRPASSIVQHMPEVFTAAFARRLNGLCRIEVKEAEDGDRVRRGRALIAPGNRHTLSPAHGAHYVVEVADGPLVSRHRPSVDVLFRSAAQAAGRQRASASS